MKSYLIVDDNVAFAENVAEIIEATGARVVVASTHDDALRLVRQVRFDALITDMRMPTMDGAQLINALRMIDSGLPAIVVTAYSADDVLDRARSEGVFAVLAKPVNFQLLIDLLGRVRRQAMVILVEDDPALRANLADLLRDQGYSVVEASSATQTRAIAAGSSCCAIVDLRLSDAPGGEIVEQLANDRPELPVIVITGQPVEGPVRGARAVLRKPFPPERLLEEVESACRSRIAG